MDIHAIRKDYVLNALELRNVNANPLEQFKIWFSEAIESKVNEPNAMVLSTVSSDLRPHSRVVLLKEFREKGFVFFTNYQSNKGREIEGNPHVSLLFFWPELERQVRIEGFLKKTTVEDSQKYFQSRPRGSQIGAHTSPQSQIIPDREWMEKKYDALDKEYQEKTIPMPENWGGYCVTPDMMEFWQGRPSRLHDRIIYNFKYGIWDIKRLAP